MESLLAVVRCWPKYDLALSSLMQHPDVASLHVAWQGCTLNTVEPGPNQANGETLGNSPDLPDFNF